jgi:hypothetical protein
MVELRFEMSGGGQGRSFTLDGDRKSGAVLGEKPLRD